MLIDALRMFLIALFIEQSDQMKGKMSESTSKTAADTHKPQFSYCRGLLPQQGKEKSNDTR